MELDQEIISFSNDEVKNIYNAEKILKIYAAAQKCNQMEKKFNLVSAVQKFKHAILEKENSYTLGAITGAFNKNGVPEEIWERLISFSLLGRKEGGRLALVNQSAANQANQRQDFEIKNKIKI